MVLCSQPTGPTFSSGKGSPFEIRADDALRALPVGDVKHRDVVLRHNYRRNAHQRKALLFAELFDICPGVSDSVPAGHHKIRPPAPRKRAFFDIFAKTPRKPPRVRRTDENIWLLRCKVSDFTPLDIAVRSCGGVAGEVCDALRHIAAVAGA